MPLYIASINSGSNGNCYYIGNNTDAVLIDAGVSCRETEKRLRRLGLSMKRVKAVFISHEHSDHISGLESIAGKYKLPVYITEKTLLNCTVQVAKDHVHYFSSRERIRIGNLTIKSFAKLHDASDPHSFIVQDDESVCIGVFTDIGKACEEVIYHFKQCNAVFLESNYDETMLAAGDYPYFLKRRITGNNGHLSNTDALQLFCTHKTEKLTHLILSHLSKNNNSPELVEHVFMPHAGETKIIVASRYRETELYTIHQTTVTEKKAAAFGTGVTQLSMF
jgi:phosphoribosyl 1,2-cyclic phosphodiesterase